MKRIGISISLCCFLLGTLGCFYRLWCKSCRVLTMFMNELNCCCFGDWKFSYTLTYLRITSVLECLFWFHDHMHKSLIMCLCLKHLQISGFTGFKLNLNNSDCPLKFRRLKSAQPPSPVLVCHLRTPDGSSYQLVFCSCYEEELGRETSGGLLPRAGSELFWVELWETLWNGEGLNVATVFSAKFWESPGEGRGCSEDCCPSGRDRTEEE